MTVVIATSYSTSYNLESAPLPVVRFKSLITYSGLQSLKPNVVKRELIVSGEMVHHDLQRPDFE